MANDIPHCSEAVAKKVVYEVTMLRHAFSVLTMKELNLNDIRPDDVEASSYGTSLSRPEEIEASVFIECFLLHARNLRSFFHPPPEKFQRDDDVMAVDFVTGWTVPTETELLELLPKEQRDRLDKSLAHLSTTRVRYDADGKGWNVVKIAEQLEKVIDRFRGSLSVETVSWFEALKRPAK